MSLHLTRYPGRIIDIVCVALIGPYIHVVSRCITGLVMIRETAEIAQIVEVLTLN